GVTRHLPAGKINSLESRLDLLHGLVPSQRAQRIHEWLGMQQAPQLFGATACQRMLDLHRTTQTHDLFGTVAALDALPARIFSPALLQIAYFVFSCGHDDFP